MISESVPQERHLGLCKEWKDSDSELFRRSPPADIKSRESTDGAGDICRTISIVFGLSTWLGLNLSETSSGRHRCYPASWWNLLNTVLGLVTYVISIIGFGMMDSDYRVAYTVYAYFTLGLLIRMTILYKKSQMYDVADKMRDTCIQLRVNAKIHLRDTKIQVVFLAIFLVMVSAVTSYFFMTVGTKAGAWQIAGYQVQTKDAAVFEYLVKISCIYMGTIGSGMISIGMILCCNCYMMADNMIQTFTKTISEESVWVCSSKHEIISHVTAYRKLMATFRSMDRVMSGLALLLYAASVTSFFNTISILLSSAKVGDVMKTQVFLSLFMAIVIFFCLTKSGSSVNSKSLSLHTALVEKAEILYRNTDDQSTMAAYQLLIASVSNLLVYFTGGEMFVIDCSLILTTAGALVTYGVIIFA